jgi:DNA polymerase-3 subunit gamma/tau
VAYVSLYRKYRSQTFGDLIGQDHVVRTIQNGITSGRIAHAYLFTGPRGTGKTSTARLVAKALNCENGPIAEPDNTCEICRSITAGACVDVLEMDAASESGVDDIRKQIVDVSEYRPVICRYKIFIIDEVHDLSRQAFDALLKTIEEPPPHIIFILATTEFNKVPPTIRSRCQRYEFHRASMQDLGQRLAYVAEHEGVRMEPAALTAIARMADGGYRDALTLLEQAMLVSESGEITLQRVYDQLGLVSEEAVDRLLVAMHAFDVLGIMDALAEIARRGRDPRAIVESMMYRLEDLTRASHQVDSGADSAREAAMHEFSTRLGRDFILRMRGCLAEAHKVIRDISLPRLWLESELLRISQAPAPIAATPVPSRAAPVTRPRPQEPAPDRTVAPSQPQPAQPQSAEKTPSQKPPERSQVARMEGDSPEAIWSRFLDALPYKDGSPAPMTRRLLAARLVGIEGEHIVVEVTRQFDAEWFTDQAARIGLANKLLRGNAGTHLTLKVRAAAAGASVGEDPGTVELALEGERLEQVTTEILSGL